MEEKCEKPTNGKKIAILAPVNRHLLLKHRQKVTAWPDGAPSAGWLNERVTGLMDKAIYRRTLGTQIQKFGFSERAESVSKRLQSRSRATWRTICGLGRRPRSRAFRMLEDPSHLPLKD